MLRSGGNGNSRRPIGTGTPGYAGPFEPVPAADVSDNAEHRGVAPQSVRPKQIPTEIY
jgi:hypothetical protein